MSTHKFVKGECQHCAGHLEFPIDAAGETIVCPHCGQSTTLVWPLAHNRAPTKVVRMVFGSVFLILAFSIAALIISGKKPNRISTPETPKRVAARVITTAVPDDETRTNEFALTALRLEKSPGSSLVYATGKVKNLSPRRRFGVKVELNLFDASNNPVGQSKDYQPLLEPGAEWHFKAMVLGSKAVVVHLNTIHEDP